MLLSLNNFRTFKWLIKLIKFFAIFIISIIILVSLILVFLPAAVSTDWSNRLIREQISNAINRPVRIDRLEWSWKDGIIIKNIVIPDLPEYSENPVITLENVKLKLKPEKLLHREVNLELLLTGFDANVIKHIDGRLNIQTLGKQSTSDKKPSSLPEPDEMGEKEKSQKAEKPFILPVDVSAGVRLKGINLLYDDQTTGRQYRVKDLEIRFEAPSFKTSPLNLAVGANLWVNNEPIPRSTVSATMNNLFNSDGTLNTKGLAANLDADLPGIVAEVDVDLADSQMKGEIRIDAASLMEAAIPLLPSFPSPTDIKGMIVLTADTGTNPDAPLTFDALLSGTDLQVSGKIINDKSIGPGNFSIHLSGIMDLKNECLDLKTGEIKLLDNSRINASARIEQINNDNPEINMALSALYLDIAELVSFARPFIPPQIEINRQGEKSEVSLTKLQLGGHMPMGRADILLDGLEISLPELILKDETDGRSKLRVSGVHANLEKFEAALTDLFPESAALRVSLAVDELISGMAEDSISVSGIRLDQLNFVAGDIHKTDSSAIGISTKLTLDNRLVIGQIQLPDLIQVKALEQSLMLNADLQPDGGINGALNHLDVNSRKISVLKEDIGPVDAGADVRLACEKLFLGNLDPANLDIKNFTAELILENALSVSLAAGAAAGGNKSFQADIKINSDLDALTKKIPPKLLSGVTGAGHLTVSLNTSGRRPDDRETEALKNMRFTDNLTFIDRLDFKIQIDNGGVEIRKPDATPVTVGSIVGSPLFSYELDGQTGKGDITSAITAGSVKGLPAIHSDASVSAKFALSAHHDYAAGIVLDQSLSVAPSNIEETLHIALDGLDRIIIQKPLPGLSTWISTAGAEIAANVSIPDCRALKELGLVGVSEADLDGLVTAKAAFQLLPGQSMEGGINLVVNDMDLAMPETISVQNVHANIDLSKSYTIKSSGLQAPISRNTGLSLNVLEAARQSLMENESNDISRHIRKIHERINPDPAVSLDKAEILAAPFPLTLDESMVMLNLNNGLPNLDYFQFNLLGGTMNGSLALLDKQDQFHVSTALTFSGINTAQIFPQAFSKDDYEEAEISGALYAEFPVTDELQPILENAAVTVEFTRIGSRALERLLYALDPYESNEAIVSQRRLLKNGSPRKIRADIRDGFLTLGGKVAVKGIEISLPSIRRLNIAQIPGMDRFSESLAGISPVIEILRRVSAEQIVVHKQTNSITFQ